ncbi:MAG: hypothetical protein GKS07_05985 [Nitrosopumilus sp.]|nr:MAG: hypothetical protein GKS07_05985 [Nitrosopumilus sp.]
MQHELPILEIILSLIVGILAIILTFVTILYARRHNLQTRKLSDFITVADSIGTQPMIKDRNEIYRRSGEIQELICKFRKNLDSPELLDLHDKTWYVYTVYNRICFILSDSNEKEFRENFIKFHGPTLCKLFITLHGLIKKWDEKQGAMNYPYLQEIVIEIKNNHSEMWNYVKTSMVSDPEIKVYDEEGKNVEKNNIDDVKLNIIQTSNYKNLNS